jgi:hypothetical protein
MGTNSQISAGTGHRLCCLQVRDWPCQNGVLSALRKVLNETASAGGRIFPMSGLRDDKLHGLELKLRKHARARDPSDERGFKAHMHSSGSCVVAQWQATGASWKKMTGDLDVTSQSGNDTTLRRSAPYDIEVVVFFIEEGKAPQSWTIVDLNWDDQSAGSFIAKARISSNGTPLSHWEEFGHGPSYTSAEAAAKDVTRRVTGSRSSRVPPFILGLIAALILLGGLGWAGYQALQKNPDQVERLIGAIKDRFPSADPKSEKVPHPRGETKPPSPGSDGDTTDKSGSSSNDLPPLQDEPNPPSTSKAPTPEAGAKPDTSAEIDDLEKALGDANRRNEELDAALARKSRELDVRRRDLATVRTRAGLSLPPCWPDTEGTYVDFVYSVHLSDKGIEVSKAYPPEREADYADLPIRAENLGVHLDRAGFIAGFRDLYDLSRSQSCRHYVHLLEGEHSDLNTYKVQRDTVEGYFYIHRPNWNK